MKDETEDRKAMIQACACNPLDLKPLSEAAKSASNLTRQALGVGEGGGASIDASEDRKAMIWEDCPACAYKHLTAAYAAVTTPEFPIRAEVYVHPSELLMARAVIAIREFRTGYRGNLALAAGCLALAENCFGIAPEELNEFRCARMHLTTGECGGTCAGAEDAENALREPSLAAFAGAHICEALRELPELADRTYAGAFFDSGAFSPDSVKDLRNWLRENIKWVADTYELFPNQEEKSDEPTSE